MIIGKLPIPFDCDFANPILRTGCDTIPMHELVKSDLKYVLCKFAKKEVVYTRGESIERDKLCNIIMKYVHLREKDGKIEVVFDEEKWNEFVKQSGLQVSSDQALKLLKKALKVLKKQYS